MTTKNQQVITGVRQEYWNALELIRNILNDSTLIAKDNDYIKVYKTLNEVLETLKPREADIVKHRFGLKDGQYHTFREIKEINKYYISLSRLRQINNKALRKLRHPARIRILDSLFSKKTEEQPQKTENPYAQYFDAVRNMFNTYSALEEPNRQEFLGKLESLLSEFPVKDRQEIPKSEEEIRKENLRRILNKTINEIEWSVRLANVFADANIKKVYQVAMISERTLLKYSRFGRKSLNEVREKLGNLGLTTEMAFDPALIE